MKKNRIFLTALIAAFTMNGLAAAQMYKYVDEKGIVHFQDSPPENVGPGVEVKLLPIIESSPENPGPAPVEIKTGTSPKIRSFPKTDYSKASVELYVTEWCRYCKDAEKFLRSKGISFIQYDIEKDKAAAIRKKELDKGDGIPFAVINGQKILGFSIEAYESALKRVHNCQFILKSLSSQINRNG